MCLGREDNFNTIGVELIGVLGGKGIGQCQKNKRQSLTGKICPDLKDKASMELIQKKGSFCLDFFIQLEDS